MPPNYWTRRFGRDPDAIGRTFHLSNDVYRVIGVLAEGFTGTEPGTLTDMFLPVTMNELAVNPMANFLRTFVRLEPGVTPGPVRERLRAAFQVLQAEETKRVPDRRAQTLEMESAGSGVSRVQRDYRLSLTVLC